MEWGIGYVKEWGVGCVGQGVVFEFCRPVQRRRKEPSLEPVKAGRHIGKPVLARGPVILKVQYHLAGRGENRDQKVPGCGGLRRAIGSSAKLSGFHCFSGFHAPPNVREE